MRVFELPEGRSACGAYHLVGNVAQWISAHQLPVVLRDISIEHVTNGVASIARLYREGVKRHRFTPLEILDKPRPAYSAEARRLQIEGEVVLEALFSASGRIRVMRVMRGQKEAIAKECLATSVSTTDAPADAAVRDVDIDGEPVTIAIVRA